MSNLVSQQLDLLLAAIPLGTTVTLTASELRSLLYAVTQRQEFAASEQPCFATPAEAEDIEGAVMTVTEAGKQIGVTRQAVLAAIRRGKLQARRLGSILLVNGPSVKAYRETRKVRPSTTNGQPSRSSSSTK